MSATASRHPLPSSPKFKNLTGRVFERLTVKAYSRPRQCPSGQVQQLWTCECECGRVVEVSTGNLTSGNSNSCGCLGRKHATEAATTHGLSKTATYRIWRAMIHRCENKNSSYYHRYGGRGVTICKRWRASFENFLADMGSRPSARHSIDRYPNNDGNYEPGNCRWATAREQSRNRSDNVIVEAFGKRMCAQDFAAEVGIGKMTLIRRIRRGWSPEKALTTPAYKKPLQ